MLFKALEIGFTIWIYSAFISLSLFTISMTVMSIIGFYKEEVE